MRAIIAGLLLISIGFLAGCNTISGLGKDIQSGGKDLQKAAQRAD